MDKKKILIVEDEPEMLKLLVLELETEGYQIYQAADGEEGFRMAQEVHPDLIISDVMMPKMDGNQFLRKLRASDFGTRIPFIILTARGKMRDYFEVVQVDGFFEKPFKTSELLAKVEEVFKKQGSTVPGTPPQESEKIQWKISGAAGAMMDDRMAQVNSTHENIRRESGPAKPGDRERRQQMAKSHEKKRILLGEDDSAVSSELGKQFLKYGYAVESVRTAGECLDAVSDFRPDVIILNYAVGETRAVELATRIKGMSGFAATPVVIYHEVFKRNAAGEIKGFNLSAEGQQLLRKIHELLGK